MKKQIVFFFLLGICSNLAFGQIIGNRAYSQNGYSPEQREGTGFMGVKSTDSTITISARVLYNLKPDYCIVTIALNQEAQSLAECLNGINKRINTITSKISAIGVKKEDYYVDFISQAKVYDYKIDMEKSMGEQKYTGLEVKKNVIVKINDLSYFDKLVEIAAEAGAYDIVKVDYRNTDLEGMYSKLFNQCSEIIEKKKALYFGDKANVKKIGVEYDNFYGIAPNERYNSYTAFETSDVVVHPGQYSHDFIKKEERKGKTFYYNGVAPSGFDRVLNMDATTVGTQYVLELSVKFRTK